MSFLAVFTAAWLLSGGTMDPVTGRKLTEMERGVSGNYATMEWRDAEDHLDGFINPAHPVEGRPFEVNVRVQGLDNTAYTGPVVLTLKKLGEQLGASATIPPTGERWKHTFTVDSSGQYQLDVSFRTTRLKIARTIIIVREDMSIAGLPLSTIGLGVVGIAALGAIGLALVRMLRARQSPAP